MTSFLNKNKEVFRILYHNWLNPQVYYVVIAFDIVKGTYPEDELTSWWRSYFLKHG